jgi:hypothetical protein
MYINLTLFNFVLSKNNQFQKINALYIFFIENICILKFININEINLRLTN